MESLLLTFGPIITLIGGMLVTYIVMRARDGGAARSPMGRSETDKLFELGFERALVGIGYLSRDGSWLSINSRLLQILGYERVDFLRTNLRNLTHSDDRKREAGMMAAMRSGKTRGYTINKRLQKRDGSFRMFRFSIVRIGGGAHHVYQCMVDEVAQQPEMQNDLVAVFAAVPEVSVIRLDPEGMITSWNRGAEELYGYSAAEMTGKPWTRLHTVSDGRSGEATRELALAASSGRFEGTDSRKRSDDSTLSVEVVIVPQFLGKDLSGFIEVARDASLSHTAREYKSAYERTRQLTEEKMASLSESNETLRAQVDRHSEIESTWRSSHERLKATNRELTGRIKVFSAAVRKLIDQRKELEETIRTERQERREAESEELSSALPPDLEWTPIGSGTSEILSFFAEDERDGVLVFRSETGEKRFTLRSGSIAACSSNSPTLILGQLLVDQELLSDSDRQKMIEVQEQTGIAFGRLLFLFELLTEEEIREAMERKIALELEELRKWTDGEYAFFLSEIGPLQIVPVNVPIRPGSESGEKPVEAIPLREEDEKPDWVAAKFVASRSARTTKFHIEGCSSVSRIPKKSRIVFQNLADAEAQGLAPCKRCIIEGAEAAS